MRYFLHLAYKGTRYHGWQRQPNVSSVQETIESALSTILSQSIRIHGCGRTDAGVHASQFFAHFDSDSVIDFDLVFRLNKMLPRDIVIYEVNEVEDRRNAQFDARERTYLYNMHFIPDPFAKELSTFNQDDLDWPKIETAFKKLVTISDFGNLCKSPNQYKHTKCNISFAEIHFSEKRDSVAFEIRADRFLQGMVRLIIARMLDIGAGKLSVAEFEQKMAAQTSFQYNNTAYPQGLFLSEVKY